MINENNLLGYDAAERHKKLSKMRAMLAEKRESALKTVTDHQFSQKIDTKPLGERTRKLLLVYGTELDTAGAKDEGESISIRNFDRV